MATGRLSDERMAMRADALEPTKDLAPDGLLLEQYALRRDEAAFSALVQRHGSLVLGVCRRVLQHAHDADDAFQATFMVLARRAGELDRSGSLGSWLYAVAYKTSLKARSTLTRRRAQERQAEEMPAPENSDHSGWAELRPVLDEELARLPEKYRAPLVLCYLQGKSHQEAASELGWPSGSMSRRMTRARELLRERLTRRGIALSSAVIFALIPKEASAAAASTNLVSLTVRAALAFGGGNAGTASIAQEVTLLAEQIAATTVITSARSTQAWIWAYSLMALGLIGSGSAYGVYRAVSSYAASMYVCEVEPAVIVPQVPPIERGLLRGHEGPVRALAFAPNSHWLASGSAKPNPHIHIWNIAQGTPLRPKFSSATLPGAVNALAFDSAGKMLASAGSDGVLRLWRLDDGLRESPPLATGMTEIFALTLSPDGRTLASAGADNLVHVWDMETRRERPALAGHTAAVKSLAFAPNGQWLASGGNDGAIHLWNLATREAKATVATGGQEVSTLVFLPDSETLLSGGGQCGEFRWSVPSLEKQPTFGTDSPVQALAILWQGRASLSGRADGSGLVRNLETGQILSMLHGHRGAVLAVAATGDGVVIATGGADGMVRLWGVEGK